MADAVVDGRRKARRERRVMVNERRTGGRSGGDGSTSAGRDSAVQAAAPNTDEHDAHASCFMTGDGDDGRAERHLLAGARGGRVDV